MILFAFAERRIQRGAQVCVWRVCTPAASIGMYRIVTLPLRSEWRIGVHVCVHLCALVCCACARFVCWVRDCGVAQLRGCGGAYVSSQCSVCVCVSVCDHPYMDVCTCACVRMHAHTPCVCVQFHVDVACVCMCVSVCKVCVSMGDSGEGVSRKRKRSECDVSSRLIVKNLGNSVDENDVRAHFEPFGEVS